MTFMKNLESFKQQFDFEINNNLLVKPFMWVNPSTLAFLELHSLSNKISLGFDDGQSYYEFTDEITFEEAFDLAKDLFEKANNILGFRITDIMFEGTAEELKETKVTQPLNT